ncbi:Nn.00g017140.m01.CDS01 [Neocucurbitaria sp. VM-36]
MAQKQANEKLHAACDECRTRKLKCSGDIPKCVRCKREKIECVYSPQKQMGRPRKRRRDGEADEPVELAAEEQIKSMTILNDFSDIPIFSDIGLISPPHLHDANSSNSTTADITPTHHDLGLPDTFGVSPISNLNFSLEPPIDPSLWDLQPVTQPNEVDGTTSDQSNMGPCTCLSIMYLTLTDLQSVQSFSFPQVVIPLRKAMSNLSDLIHCPQCPKEMFSAIQNVQSIVALFKAIVERFNKVLREVDAEAERLQQNGQKKPYRIGDNNPALFHLHTGTLDCPMGFNIELEARDWKRIVKTALRTEINGGGSNPRPLIDLLKEIEVRQERWHNDKEFLTEERGHMFAGGTQECKTPGLKTCEALGAEHIRRAINNLNFE